jgi:1-acyl-sn-glycerol-3-phosphate acyltransferase
MLRTILSPLITVVGLLIVVIATIVLGTTLMVVVRISPDSKVPGTLARIWSRIFLAVTATRSTIDGLHHIEPGTSYVVVSNHISNLDPPFHIAHLPLPIRFLAKKELFRLPVFGSAMRAYGIVETDRQGQAAAHRAINEQVAVQVARGMSLIIYPEGTRSKSGTLAPFKRGAFRIAIDNGMPILPTALVGTHEAWVPGSKIIRGGSARALVGKPIPVAGLTPQDIGRVRDEAYAAIVDMLRELGGHDLINE